jgi:hypothetical protein
MTARDDVAGATKVCERNVQVAAGTEVAEPSEDETNASAEVYQSTAVLRSVQPSGAYTQPLAVYEAPAVTEATGVCTVELTPPEADTPLGMHLTDATPPRAALKIVVS